MKTKSSLFSTIFLAALLAIAEAQAGTLDDIGFTDLKLELGSALPDGSSISVTQVEAPVSVACIPDMTLAEFNLITFNDYTLGVTGCTDGLASGHATSVAQRFYGAVTSSSTAIGSVDLFEAVNWLDTGFLNVGKAAPNISTTRLANHSWIGGFLDNSVDPPVPYTALHLDALRRLDYVVEMDEFIQVAAMSATTITKPLLSDSFNAIVVGLSNGGSGTATSSLDTIYVSGRARPDIVAPESNVSSASPRGASAAALLVDYAHTNSLLSNGSTSNRNSSITIYNAERSETIKAVLMAGADRNTVGNTNPAAPNNVDIIDYRADITKQTSNGLDKRFGAGQVNVYNSYHVLAGGEQNSAEEGGIAITSTGFDYNPAFGGLNSSNITATYGFSTGTIGGQKIKAALVWNLEVFDASSANLYNLDLQLIDLTAGGNTVATSSSTIDNTENIWFDLKSNNDYQLKVTPGAGQAAFEWDYALAWQIMPSISVVETASTTVTREDGTTDTFTVVLDSPPAGDVTIDLVSSDKAEGTVSPSSLTFTSANWSTLQTVTVTGVNDAIDDGNKNYSIDFTVSSVDANYNGLTLPSVSASNTDDDATFSFSDQTDVALNTLIASNTVVMAGLLGTTAISVTGGEYSINGGAYTSTIGNISNTDSVTLQTTSSVTGSTSVDVMLTIGDVGDTFSITTEIDTDADGVGDSVDAFPNDPTETVDTDGDGVGDNADAFPNDATETQDTDSDGIGDNTDAFPNNIAASVDTDNDGKPDEWNASCDATCQVSSGLTLDVATSSASSGGGGSLSLIWLLLPLFITAGRRRVL